MTEHQLPCTPASSVSIAVPPHVASAISGIVWAPSTRITGEAHGRMITHMTHFGANRRTPCSLPPERSP